MVQQMLRFPHRWAVAETLSMLWAVAMKDHNIENA